VALIGENVRCIGAAASAVVEVRVEHHVVLLHFAGADIHPVPEMASSWPCRWPR
jgi:hypothetical protein